MTRSVSVLVDRAIPVLEQIARGNTTITYSGLAALITRPGESLVSSQLIGHVLGRVLDQALSGDPRPWLEFLPAVVVLRETGETGDGWFEYRALRNQDEMSPGEARAVSHGLITLAWSGSLLNQRVADASRLKAGLVNAGSFDGNDQ